MLLCLFSLSCGAGSRIWVWFCFNKAVVFLPCLCSFVISFCCVVICCWCVFIAVVTFQGWCFLVFANLLLWCVCGLCWLTHSLTGPLEYLCFHSTPGLLSRELDCCLLVLDAMPLCASFSLWLVILCFSFVFTEMFFAVNLEQISFFHLCWSRFLLICSCWFARLYCYVDYILILSLLVSLCTS